jgi:hypothetical protein
MCDIFYSTPIISISTVTTANWRFTPIHMGEGRIILGAKFKLLYREIALSLKPFGMGHTCIFSFLLEWPILWPPRILTFPPETSCIYGWNLTYMRCVSRVHEHIVSEYYAYCRGYNIRIEHQAGISCFAAVALCWLPGAYCLQSGCHLHMLPVTRNME